MVEAAVWVRAGGGGQVEEWTVTRQGNEAVEPQELKQGELSGKGSFDIDGLVEV